MPILLAFALQSHLRIVPDLVVAVAAQNVLKQSPLDAMALVDAGQNHGSCNSPDGWDLYYKMSRWLDAGRCHGQ